MGSATDQLLQVVRPEDRPGAFKVGNATQMLLRGVETQPEAVPGPVITEADTTFPTTRPERQPAPQGSTRKQFPARTEAEPDILFEPGQTQPGASFSSLFKAGFADDPKTQIRIFAAARFPNIPIDEAVQRYGIINGEISFVDDAGVVNRETPDSFLSQAKRIAAQTGSTLPSIVLGAIGAGGGPAIAALGAGGGEAIRKIVGNLVFDEPQTSLGVAGDIALETTIGGVSELGGAQVAKLVKRGLAKTAPKAAPLERARVALSGEFRGLDTKDAAKVRDLARDQFGIELPVAASTGSSELADLTTLFSRRAGTADIVEGGRRKLQFEIDRASKEFLDSFAGPEVSAFGAGERVAGAARTSIEALEKARTARVRPLFEEAFLRAPAIDTKPVLDQIDGLLATLPETSEPARTLLKIKALFFRTVDEPADEARARLINQASRDLAPIREEALQAADVAERIGRPLERRTTIADIRKTVNAGLDTDPLLSAVESAKQGGRIRLSDLRRFFGVKPGQSSPEMNELTSRWPALFSSKGKVNMEKFAQAEGFADENDLISQLLNAKTRSMQVEKTVDDFLSIIDDNASQGLEGADLIDLQIDELNARLSKKPPQRPPSEAQQRRNIPETRLRVLDTVKKLIDPLLEGPAGTSIDKDTLRRIQIIKDQLVKTMDEASPSYANARRAFAELSPEVDAAKASLVGTTGKLTGDRQVQAVKRIFSSLDSTPETVAKAKKLIEGQDPEAWQQGLRIHFQQILGNLKLPRGPRAKNVGAAFEQAVRGKPLQAEILQVAMGKKQFRNFTDFMDILKRTGLIFEANSTTSTQIETLTRVDNAALGGTIRGGIVAFSEPRKALARFLTESMIGRNHKQLAEALFSEEAGKQLLEMKRLSPGSEQLIRRLSVFLGIGAGGEIERGVQRLGIEDIPIPVLSGQAGRRSAPQEGLRTGVTR